MMEFHLPKTTRVELSVYNLLGQRVSILIEGVLSAGEHSVSWDGRDAPGHSQPGGIYFYRIDSELGSLKRKMVLIK
jgi:flagellar hook assembly protein FlgD